MKSKNLVAFVANGSILPRESGVSNKPLKDGIKFISPKSLDKVLYFVSYVVLDSKDTTYKPGDVLSERLQRAGHRHIAGSGLATLDPLVAAAGSHRLCGHFRQTTIWRTGSKPL